VLPKKCFYKQLLPVYCLSSHSLALFYRTKDLNFTQEAEFRGLQFKASPRIKLMKPNLNKQAGCGGGECL
jgi:hypothetical protein